MILKTNSRTLKLLKDMETFSYYLIFLFLRQVSDNRNWGTLSNYAMLQWHIRRKTFDISEYRCGRTLSPLAYQAINPTADGKQMPVTFIKYIKLVARFEHLFSSFFFRLGIKSTPNRDNE